jgi:hypothetical protein
MKKTNAGVEIVTPSTDTTMVVLPIPRTESFFVASNPLGSCRNDPEE